MKNNLEDRMAKKLEARKISRESVIIEKKISVVSRELIEKIIFTENEELDNYLYEKSIELLETQAKTSIELGKIFTEVQMKIEEGTYSSWLEFNGFSRATAIRHKRRYNLYEKLKEDKKAIVSHLTVRELEHIYRTDEKVYLDLINDGVTLEEIKKIIHKEKENLIPQSIQIEKTPEITIMNKVSVLSKLSEEHFKNLDIEKKLKIENYLKKIEKLLI
ncbi:MAG: hypothetical protein ACRCZ9_03720 [Fusobacteriaceae bacterium]